MMLAVEGGITVTSVIGVTSVIPVMGVTIV